MNHATARARQAEFGKESQLPRLRDFAGESTPAVDHAGADPFEMRKKIKGVKNRAATVAEISRGAHAIEEEREFALRIRGIIEEEIARVDRNVIDLPAIQFGKEGAKPIRMLVIDGELAGRSFSSRQIGCGLLLVERSGRESLHE